MPTLEQAKRVRDCRKQLADEAIDRQITRLQEVLASLERLKLKNDRMGSSGCEAEEAVWEAAVLAVTYNQYIINDATANTPIYAAAEQAAYEAMEVCWAGGPSG